MAELHEPLDSSFAKLIICGFDAGARGVDGSVSTMFESFLTRGASEEMALGFDKQFLHV